MLTPEKEKCLRDWIKRLGYSDQIGVSWAHELLAELDRLREKFASLEQQLEEARYEALGEDL